MSVMSTSAQLRHAPSAPTYDTKHPDFQVRAKNNEQKCDGFLNSLAPARVGVGYPKESNVKNDEYAAQNERGHGEQSQAG